MVLKPPVRVTSQQELVVKIPTLISQIYPMKMLSNHHTFWQQTCLNHLKSHIQRVTSPFYPNLACYCKNCDFPQFFVCLPEGSLLNHHFWMSLATFLDQYPTTSCSNRFRARSMLFEVEQKARKSNCFRRNWDTQGHRQDPLVMTNSSPWKDPPCY